VHAKNNRAYESIREATHGLVFFAVPHQGGEGANLGTIASNLVASITGNAQNSLVESLKKNSYFTETQARLFKNQLEDFQIRTFVEGRKTKLKRFSIFRPVTSKVYSTLIFCISMDIECILDHSRCKIGDSWFGRN
jgi:hypothetical protein